MEFDVILRSVFTLVSFITFIGIVWWAWTPTAKKRASIVMTDVMNDDDLPLVSDNKRV